MVGGMQQTTVIGAWQHCNRTRGSWDFCSLIERIFGSQRMWWSKNRYVNWIRGARTWKSKRRWRLVWSVVFRFSPSTGCFCRNTPRYFIVLLSMNRGTFVTRLCRISLVGITGSFISCLKLSKLLYTEMSSWWEEYELGHALFPQTSLLFLYLLNAFPDGQKT